MKVGSLVTPLKDWNNVWPPWANVKVPKLGEIYTIRSIQPSIKPVGWICILLEEIVNDYCPGTNIEFDFNIEDFKELQPPMDITQIIKNCIEESKTNVCFA